MTENSAHGPIQVLVVDDSAVVRQVMQAVLAGETDMAVTVAADPLIAIEKMKQLRPHVILLDLEMPRMDGLTFLRKIMAEDPVPTVVCSGVAARGTEAAMRALEAGAVGIVTKPSLGVKEFLQESALLLVDMVRSAAQARVRRRAPLPALPVPPKRKAPATRIPAGPPRPATERIVAIGASTGGAEALTEILTAMPADAPGIVIVQHMPELFTAAFANHLNELCQIEVKEAEGGDLITSGRAFIAPGNYHATVFRQGAQYRIGVREGPLVSRHRPSVDVLFRSVAEAAGSNAAGVILTGMGNDGAQGMVAMKRAGAYNIAQDEATCVVFGMPREAMSTGAVDDVAPLQEIAGKILRWKRAAS
ncbi:MAG: chemotaxis response regulator protein-glutamate methylesterase [Acidobacteriia bacterium]|nr:chemotaxis response regulator protein-glutamate methylesterase [Terriglobia bacterium]